MKRIFAILCVLLLVGISSSAQEESEGGTFVDSLVGGDISTLNPILATDGNSILTIAYIYEGLFNPNPETGLPEPALANWEISEDGLTYTFTLVDANWSDGTPITSKDVKFTYDAIMSDEVQSPRKADVAAIASVEVVDDKTFVVTLNEPNCTIWGNAFGVLSPLPSHLYSEDFSEFMANPNNTEPQVSSGPYLFAERSPGEFVRLTVNENYFGQIPEIENIVSRVVADPATVNQSLQTDTIDYAFMYPDQLAQLQEQEKFNTFLYPNNNTPIVMMNYQDPENPVPAYAEDGSLNEITPNKFFNDIRVRQAVAMGYDKAALAMTLGEGSAPLTGPVTPAFYDAFDMSGVEPWPYDPEAAAALLEEAGWVDTNGDGVREKDGVDFEVDLVYSPLVDLWANIATVMQDQLGQIGIKVNVSTMEWSAYLSNVLLPMKYDITIVGFGGGTEIDGIAYNLLNSKNVVPGGGFNLVGYVNPEMDALLEQGRTLAGCSLEERLPIYQQIQQIARDDVPYDWTVSTTQVHVFNNRVTNVDVGQWSGGNANMIPGWGLSR